jgi:NADPH:quinone reductase-like Zn-dependent oxidoreductase
MVDTHGVNDITFEVHKSDTTKTRFIKTPVPELTPGQVLFRVDRFALTANNITYALAGDALGYWRFFPCEEGWGRIPAMGFADVIRSTHPEVKEGTRCFGFYPMGQHLVIEPGSVSPHEILDGAAHRAGLAPVYAQYLPTTGDPYYAEHREDQNMLMRGLFMTSFLAEDFLADREYSGANSVLISSASSKTSIALAFRVKQAGRARAIGLTSARNEDFTRKLGFYDEVVLYDDVESLAVEDVAFVDMAGDDAVNTAIHHHYGEALKADLRIGFTHGPNAKGFSMGGSDDLPGAKAAPFFAPAQAAKRIGEWGAAGFAERVVGSWTKYCDASDAWLNVHRSSGRDGVSRVFTETLSGHTSPADGHVISL